MINPLKAMKMKDDAAQAVDILLETIEGLIDIYEQFEAGTDERREKLAANLKYLRLVQKRYLKELG